MGIGQTKGIKTVVLVGSRSVGLIREGVYKGIVLNSVGISSHDRTKVGLGSIVGVFGLVVIAEDKVLICTGGVWGRE